MINLEWYALSIFIVGAGLPTLYFLYLGKLSSNKPVLLFICGAFLILFGAHGLDLLIGLREHFNELQPGKKLTADMIARIKHNNEIWIYIFPIASAAIGANLIASAITSNTATNTDLTRELAQAQEISGNLIALTRAIKWIAVLFFSSSLLYFISSLLNSGLI